MQNQPIGLIGAMTEEIERIVTLMEHESDIREAGIRYYRGNIHGHDVVLCKSGVGKVNAAVCTQILIDRFDAGAVIFTGVAGALDPRLEIGDLVISETCVQHDMDVSALGFARGQIPYEETYVFPASQDLVALARASGERLYPGRVYTGRILSGDQFIADRDTVRQLHEELQGTCTEMEGAAVAQVCHMNGIPFVILRSMSDKADGSAHVNFPEFTKLAAEHSSAIVGDMLKQMR